MQTFYRKNFIPFLKELVSEYNLIAKNICLEITEEMSLNDDKETEERFKQIKECGFLLALDDFSMGHTSLKYLQSNQFDFVKIDGNLVQAMKNNSRSQEIIASIVYLSKSLDFSVIAEYVETKDEQKKLEEVGCKTYQGYLYGPALPLNTLLSSKT